MAKTYSYLSFLLMFMLFACSNPPEEVELSEDTETTVDVEETETEEESESQRRVKREYDLSVISKSCRELLDSYEELQVKMVDAKKKYEIDTKDTEQADKYFDLISQNSKFLSDPKTADCSGDLNFQYALADIADKYSKELND